MDTRLAKRAGIECLRFGARPRARSGHGNLGDHGRQRRPPRTASQDRQPRRSETLHRFAAQRRRRSFHSETGLAIWSVCSADSAKRIAARSAERNGPIRTADSSDHRARWLLCARARRKTILSLHHPNSGRTGREDRRHARLFASPRPVAFAVSTFPGVNSTLKSARRQPAACRFHHNNTSTQLHSMKYLLFIPIIFLFACASHSPKTNAAASAAAPVGKPANSDTLRTDEQLKEYRFGRYIDPRDPLAMHEAPPIYLVT